MCERDEIKYMVDLGDLIMLLLVHPLVALVVIWIILKIRNYSISLQLRLQQEYREAKLAAKKHTVSKLLFVFGIILGGFVATFFVVNFAIGCISIVSNGLMESGVIEDAIMADMEGVLEPYAIFAIFAMFTTGYLLVGRAIYINVKCTQAIENCRRS